MKPSLDLSQPRRMHIVGVGGAGMSAIAAVLAGMGHRVSGSDLKRSAAFERLHALGLDVRVGHDPALVEGADVVAISTAVPQTNEEVAAARARGIPVLRRAEILAAITGCRRTIAVAGTHGKTTTSSMLALVLVEAGFRPSFLIGGDVNEAGGGAVWDEGEWLVVEADESDGTFLELGAEAVIVTNIEADHLEHYGSVEHLADAFAQFVTRAPGSKVLCVDDPRAADLARRSGAETYGIGAQATWHMRDIQGERAGVHFVVDGPPGGIEVALPVPGLHNARNATAALAAGVAAGVPVEAAVRALSRYAGVARRYQFRGELAGVTFIDDYAHLPTEVAAALATARQGGWRRVVALFQPHRYSRTASLWPGFADAFVDADLLAVTDVYAAGEEPRPGVTGKLIVDAVLGAHPDARVAWVPSRASALAYLAGVLRPGDLCLTLGAGDVTTVADELGDLLATR